MGDSEAAITNLIAPANTIGPPQKSPMPEFNPANSGDNFCLKSGGLLDGDFSLRAIRKKASDIVEKRVISQVLAKTGWNRSKATKILGISYKTLLYKIQKFGLQPPLGL